MGFVMMSLEVVFAFVFALIYAVLSFKTATGSDDGTKDLMNPFTTTYGRAGFYGFGAAAYFCVGLVALGYITLPLIKIS